MSIPCVGHQTKDYTHEKVDWSRATDHGRPRDPSPPLSPNVTCSFFLRLCSEVPILEDTLMRILVIGLSRELPLGPADAMELADHLVKRAAAVQADGNAVALCPSFHQSQRCRQLSHTLCSCDSSLGRRTGDPH